MRGPTVRYSIRLSAELNEALEGICARRRNLTKKAIIEAALKEYLYPEGADKRELEFSRFMDRIEKRLKAEERYLEIVGETLSLYIRVWLTQTRELPEEQQELAKRIGGKRYRRFLEILGENLRQGKSIFEELPGEVYCGEDAFFEAGEEEISGEGVTA
ncbi:hypothetical protein KP004_20065 [Geomonas oryzisoli]|uniref:Ribbon-helix-helix protein, CopG family n=1 Tax=Geomonas oryzisoli TaxID=2847992 RepID=A0ABX8J4P9_9BACT|nr:ribbon-helix-helix protein, CopG family [Geomonas oryzisoli]QWV93428.1 hypothetical protein KP004_20065 [Geomonas oryzisoli]